MRPQIEKWSVYDKVYNSGPADFHPFYVDARDLIL
jgi:hypothetical protein